VDPIQFFVENRFGGCVKLVKYLTNPDKKINSLEVNYGKLPPKLLPPSVGSLVRPDVVGHS
jgi:hypothetical protein